jgi:hypothetical protein
MRIAALLAALLLAPFLAVASSESQAQLLDPPTNDSELSRFVDAFINLVGLRHGTMIRLHEEADPEKQNEIKSEALNAMTSTVEQHGLTVDRYNDIATALQNDSELQDRVGTLLQQMAEASPSAGQE